MPRPRSIIPKRSWLVRLPDDLSVRVLADLYSPAEGCIPYGKFSGFIEQCIREHYARLDEDRKHVESRGTVEPPTPPSTDQLG